MPNGKIWNQNSVVSKVQYLLKFFNSFFLCLVVFKVSIPRDVASGRALVKFLGLSGHNLTKHCLCQSASPGIYTATFTSKITRAWVHVLVSTQRFYHIMAQTRLILHFVSSKYSVKKEHSMQDLCFTLNSFLLLCRLHRATGSFPSN